MAIGFRILPRKQAVDAKTAEAFRALPVANVGDCMHRVFAGGAALRPIHASGKLAGPALTVRTRPGDNLMVHKAIDIAEPGDVIVVDAGGDMTQAIIGEIMVHYGKSRGLAGFIINGAVRDAEELREINLPVYAAGVTHRGPYKDGPGEINAAISLGGMVINPGDLIVGDADGVLCVPLPECPAVLEKAQAKQAAETVELDKIKKGTLDRAWVDEALKRGGCEM